MIGTKPQPAERAHLVVREFRGQRLYLQDFARTNSTYRWTANVSKAQRMSLPTAIDASDRASREFGARCSTIDAQGNMAQTQDQAAENARALLSACTNVKGKVDEDAFYLEMETRAGGKLTQRQYRLLARIVKAYEQERAT